MLDKVAIFGLPFLVQDLLVALVLSWTVFLWLYLKKQIVYLVF